MADNDDDKAPEGSLAHAVAELIGMCPKCGAAIPDKEHGFYLVIACPVEDDTPLKVN